MLELALREALSFGHNDIGTEHVWAALCGMLHAQHLYATGEHEPDLDHANNRTVDTTV